MSLCPGARLGAYEVIRLLGAGGMGDVYEARDTRLGRTVALKVLSESVSASPARRERFEREARAVAALNHPNICSLFDIGTAAVHGEAQPEPVRYLVMEFLEGQTLAERLLKGPLPVPEVLRYAAEIADALDHAHRRGLVHRDLKPANVMLTARGAKLLDFGLSKAQHDVDVPSLSTVSREDAALTADGALLGTFPYTAPEQLVGGRADARSDIFSFGATVYEMATGRRAFAGATRAATIGAVLHEDPPPASAVAPLVPAAFERVLSRCLEKSPDDRWQTARDLAFEVRGIGAGVARPFGRGGRLAPRSVRRAAALSALVTAGAAAPWLLGTSLPRETVRLAFAPPRGITSADLVVGGPVVVSPDGTRLAFVARSGDGPQLLWVRSLNSTNAQPLAGTDGAAHPFWSPDGRFLGFFAQRKLKRVSVSGGPPQALCDATLPRGGTWSREGVIVYSAGAGRHLYRVDAAGGMPVALPPDNVSSERYWPSFLPDGRRFIYFGRPQHHGVYAASLDSAAPTLLLSGAVAAEYAAPGFLLALVGPSRGAPAWTLVAYRFDSERLAVSGDPVPIAERVGYESGLARGAFSVSATGVLVHGDADPALSTLVWFDRAGRRIADLGSPAPFGQPALSPDGHTVAVELVDRVLQDQHLWLIDLRRNVAERFTSAAGLITFMPVWSPQGDRIVFSSARGSPPNLYVRQTSAGGEDRRLLHASSNHQPTDWSADGGTIVFADLDVESQWDLWLLPLPADRGSEAVPFLRTPFNEHLGRLSPNGRWMAYASDESGANEIYVRSVADSGIRRRVSPNGGNEPRWRGDGRELFYRAPDGTLMSVPLPAEAAFDTPSPVPLFRVAYGPVRNSGYDVTYAVTRDGGRFLISTPDEHGSRGATNIVLGWTAVVTH